LHETQSSLATHVEKIRALEGMLAEHDAMKREVGNLREMMEERKRDMRLGGPRHLDHRQLQRVVRRDHDIGGEGDGEMDSDDDARSIHTIIPHELERVDEEDEDQLAADEEEEEDRRRRREELGRPRTPEPTGMMITMTDDDFASPRRSPSPPHPEMTMEGMKEVTRRSKAGLSIVDELTHRLATLTDQLESALELSSTLQAQHAVAQGTISQLESKVSALESLVHVTQSQIQSQALEKEREREKAKAKEKEQPQGREDSLSAMLNEWKKGLEGQWSTVKEEWSQERERLSRAREEWEGRVRHVEGGLGTVMGKIDHLSFQQRPLINGDLKHLHGGGLVTPPSPRSLSADSNRPRQRKRRSGSSRGRSRSRSRSMPNLDTADSEGSQETTDSSARGSVDSDNGFPPFPASPGGGVVGRGYAPEGPDPSYLEMLEEKMKMTMKAAARSLATPDPSIQLSTSTATIDSNKSAGGLAEDGVRFLFAVVFGICRL
jgi:hypothetical protein